MKYILIADDEPMNQGIFTELLEDDYELATVDDGGACLESVEQRTPDLLLLDYSMPVIDGLGVCVQLRANEKYREVPIIMVTGHATDEVREKCMAAGATDYLSKPFDVRKFKAFIDLHIE